MVFFLQFWKIRELYFKRIEENQIPSWTKHVTSQLWIGSGTCWILCIFTAGWNMSGYPKRLRWVSAETMRHISTGALLENRAEVSIANRWKYLGLLHVLVSSLSCHFLIDNSAIIIVWGLIWLQVHAEAWPRLLPPAPPVPSSCHPPLRVIYSVE